MSFGPWCTRNDEGGTLSLEGFRLLFNPALNRSAFVPLVSKVCHTFPAEFSWWLLGAILALGGCFGGASGFHVAWGKHGSWWCSATAAMSKRRLMSAGRGLAPRFHCQGVNSSGRKRGVLGCAYCLQVGVWFMGTQCRRGCSDRVGMQEWVPCELQRHSVLQNGRAGTIWKGFCRNDKDQGGWEKGCHDNLLGFPRKLG